MYRTFGRIALITTSILLLLRVLMLFTDEINWQTSDFVIAWFLLAGTGLAYTFISSKVKGGTFHRLGTGLAILSALFLVWMNLAVGIIGDEGHTANLMYLGVLVSGFLVAFKTGFTSEGMGWAMCAMALTQIVVAFVAWGTGIYHDTGTTVDEVALINGVFVVLFLASASLFRSASMGSHTPISE